MNTAIIKKYIKIFIMVCFLINVFCFNNDVFCGEEIFNEVVNIPDPNLAKAIRQKLWIPQEASITKEQMARIKELFLSYTDIENLEGLRHAVSLEYINLECNNIRDISELKYLKKLKEINLARNFIRDIKPLVDLKNLKILNLYKNRITDISTLGLLSNNEFTRVNIAENFIDLDNELNIKTINSLKDKVSDAYVLYEPQYVLPQGVDEEVDGSDFDPDLEKEVIFSDDKLEKLIRESLNKLQGIITISDMKQLDYLYAHNTNITNLDGLQYAVNIEFLDLSNNNISDISVLSNLNNLKWLELSNNKISDISIVENLKNLEYIGLCNNRIKDIKQLNNLKNNVLELDVRYNFFNLLEQNTIEIINYYKLKLSNSFYYEPQKMLTDMNLSEKVSIPDKNLEEAVRNTICKLEGDLYVEDMLDLLYLYAGNKEINIIEGLQFAINIEDLSLSNNNIRDIDQLSQLNNIKLLDLKNCNLSELKPLMNLNNLKFVDLSYNNIRDISVFDKIIDNLMYVDLTYNILNLEEEGTKYIINKLVDKMNENFIYIPQKTTDERTIDVDLVIEPETSGGAGKMRVIKVKGNDVSENQNKYLVVQLTEGVGQAAKVSVTIVSISSNEFIVSYPKKDTKVEVWITSGIPNLRGKEMGVDVYAYKSSDM